MENNNSDTGFVFCKACGKKNEHDAKFCTNCATSLSVDTAKEEYKDNLNISKELYQENYKTTFDNKDIENFVYKNAEYYIPKFNAIKQTGQQTSWNWIAFLIPAYWALYRKMYLIGAILIGVNLILPIRPMVVFIVNLAVSIGFGLYGNYLYLNHTEKRLDSIKHLDNNAREVAIRSNGGVNLPLAIAVPVIGFILILIPIVMFGLFAAAVYRF